jgi:hypothetical protein
MNEHLFSVGELFHLVNDAGLLAFCEVVETTEKAVKVKADFFGPAVFRWLPKSALKKQKRHELLHETTPDAFKIAQWCKFQSLN